MIELTGMAHTLMMVEEDGGRGFLVNNDDCFDHGTLNRKRNEIKELSEQVVTLYDKVHLLLLKREVATSEKKLQRLFTSIILVVTMITCPMQISNRMCLRKR